jgi:(4S)-4-hydroxy-5-phosphonooxypentane-2,3-dione isomerase
MFVVTVDFVIKDEFVPVFMGHMCKNAETSLQDEDNCMHFDVCVSALDERNVFLYEIYTTQQDFESHLKSPHFTEFNEVVSPMVLKKTVRTFTLIG